MEKKLVALVMLVFAVGLSACGNEEGEIVTIASSERIQPLEVDRNDYNNSIIFDDFFRDPEGLSGSRTTFVSKIFQVVNVEKGDDLLQFMGTVNIDSKTKRTVLLVLKKENLATKILADDELRVWVTSLGEIDYVATGGVDKTVLGFRVDSYDVIGVD